MQVRLKLLAVVCLLFSTTVLADEKANFTGYWVLDQDKSAMEDGRGFENLPIELSITQNKEFIEIERIGDYLVMSRS